MLLHSRTGLVVNPRKIRKHYTAKCQQKVSKDSGDMVKMSPAEQVICSLTSKKNVLLVYLVANVKLGRDLVTTYTKKKRASKAKRQLEITFESNIVDNGGEPTTMPVASAEIMASSDGATSAADTPEKTAEDIYNSLGINCDTQILLGVCWCTDKQRRLLGLFPEAASADVIFKTNNEKRPMKHICSKTSSNETFGGLYAFLPSQATWVFDYMWRVAVPALTDPRFRARNQQMNTDGDDKIYNPFIAQIPRLYPNSKHRLCGYHLFMQGWPQNGITTKRINDGAGEIGATILEAIKNWVLLWTTDVESPEELHMLHK